MLKLLQALQLSLNKFGHSNESALISFLLKIAGYDDEWKEQIESLSAKNTKPFNDWFGGQDRIYLDFKPNSSSYALIDEDVKLALEEFGFEITDYVGGYCQKNGRTFKIGKVIQIALNEDLKEEKAFMTERSPEQIENKMEEIREYWKSISNQFVNSSFRKNKRDHDSLKVVISQNPHDIAKMSYERNWTSCMELGNGVNYQNLFCEVQIGGFIAYLVREDDLEVEDPIARIHIRRFLNSEGVNLAKPENRVYGNDIPGFKDFVNNWVAENNRRQAQEFGDKSVGIYKRKGGKYSDTFEKSIIVAPNDVETLLDWFYGRSLPNNKVWELYDRYFETLERVGYIREEGHPFGEFSDGVREFKTQEEAWEFREQLIREDSGEGWFDALMADTSQTLEPYERERSIREMTRSRYGIRVADIKSDEHFKEMAAEELIKHLSELSKDDIINLERYLFSGERKSKDLFPIYKIYPELLTVEKFLGLGVYEQRKWLDELSEFDPQLFEIVNGYLEREFSYQLDKDGIPVKSAINRVLNGTRYSDKSYEKPIDEAIYDIVHKVIQIPMNKKLYEIFERFVFNDAKEILDEFGPEVYEKFLDRVLTNIPNKIMPNNEMIDFAKKMFAYIDFSIWSAELLDSTNLAFKRLSVSDWLFLIAVADKEVISGLVPELNLIKDRAESDVLSNPRIESIFPLKGERDFQAKNEINIRIDKVNKILGLLKQKKS